MKIECKKCNGTGKEICICAAVKTTTGEIIRGHRHGDCFYSIQRIKKKIMKHPLAQGFITSKNRYVDRKEGAKLQNMAGILSVWTGTKIKKILFSEDLY